ncbi:MAG: hypothetical protein SGJ19_01960 [Planctomycetia bacterium]|nr:hypothetical protein [Planctomycetia bacterium]
MGFTEFSGSKWEKECVDAMEKVLKEKQLNIDMWKRLKAETERPGEKGCGGVGGGQEEGGRRH